MSSMTRLSAQNFADRLLRSFTPQERADILSRIMRKVCWCCGLEMEEGQRHECQPEDVERAETWRTDT